MASPLLPPSLLQNIHDAAAKLRSEAQRREGAQSGEGSAPIARLEETRTVIIPYLTQLRTELAAFAGAQPESQQGAGANAAVPEAITKLGPKATALAKDAIAVEVRKFVLEAIPRGADSAEVDPIAVPSQAKSFESGADESSESSATHSMARLFDRLDIVLVLEQQGIVETSLPLQLLEDLFECLPILSCSPLFGYMESRFTAITADIHPSKGKGLTLLRLCNDLLRRLSRPDRAQTIFAGRVLSLLSAVFPLGERSGVNLRGDFNVDNRTVVEPLPELEVAADKGVEEREAVEGREEDKQDAATPAEDGKDAAEIKATSSGGDAGPSAPPTEQERNELLLGCPASPAFYRAFWSLQRYFSDPSSWLFGAAAAEEINTFEADVRRALESLPEGLAELHADPSPEGAKGTMSLMRRTVRLVMRVFDAVARRERELAGAAAADEKAWTSRHGSQAAAQEGVMQASAARPAGAGLGPDEVLRLAEFGGADADAAKKKRLPATEEPSAVARKRSRADEAPSEGEGNVDGGDGGTFFAKFLTGRNLLEYEVRDNNFRRHVLVQLLILFQYLLGFTPTQRERWKDWKNKQLQAVTFVLDESDDKWIRETWKEVLSQLKEIPPEGKVFSDSVLQALKRESRWIAWKTDNCPPIDRAPLNAEQIVAFATARSNVLRPQRAWPHTLGTAALSALWEDGVRPPEPGKRRVEDAEGNEVEIDVDGLDELEMPPRVPDLRNYARRIQLQEAKADRRRAALGWDKPDPVPPPPGASAPAAEALKEQEYRKRENERLSRERVDEALTGLLESQQSLSWRALRLAARDHLGLFARIRVDSVELLVRSIDEEEQRAKRAAEEAEEAASRARQAAERAEGSEDGGASREAGEDAPPTKEDVAALRAEADVKAEEAVAAAAGVEAEATEAPSTSVVVPSAAGEAGQGAGDVAGAGAPAEANSEDVEMRDAGPAPDGVAHGAEGEKGAAEVGADQTAGALAAAGGVTDGAGTPGATAEAEAGGPA